jgi:Mn2+/Fe2+ NRAMP family transporter
MRSVLAYTAARVMLFAATTGVLYLLGARGLLLLALAVLISGLVSLVLLARQRDAMSAAVLAGARKGRQNLERKIEESRTSEDDDPTVS